MLVRVPLALRKGRILAVSQRSPYCGMELLDGSESMPQVTPPIVGMLSLNGHNLNMDVEQDETVVIRTKE